MKTDFKAPTTHIIGSVLALLALVVMALGIGALTYQSRVLHLAGMFWEWFSLVVAFAPTASTLVIAWYKLFAVSDEHHDNWLWGAFGVDMLGITVQLVGVGLAAINVTDDILLGIRAASFAFSGMALIAVAMAAGTSGYRKIKVREHQRAVDFEQTFNDLFNEALRSEDIEQEMHALAKTMIQEKARQMTGQRVARFTEPLHGGLSLLFDRTQERAQDLTRAPNGRLAELGSSVSSGNHE